MIALDELLPEAILARSQHLSARLAHQLLGVLTVRDDERRRALLDTLEVYLRSGLNRAASATELHLHPNSLDLRLRRIQQLTGTDLHSVRDIVRLWLALRARQTWPRDDTGEHARSAASPERQGYDNFAANSGGDERG